MQDLEVLNESKIQNLKSKIGAIPIPQSQLRILLWDIDGTLLQSGIKGSFKEYFAHALEKVYGTSGNIAEVNAAGSTDSQIILKALESEGFTVTDVFSKLDEFTKVLLEEMNLYIQQNENVYEILPGVREVLETTSQNPRLLNSLLTGNLAVGAESKLRYIDLWHYFQNLPHAYGDISHDRRELGKVAEKMINDFLGIELNPKQFIVIGDTKHDIAAARAFGAKVIAVGTGRGVDFDELRAQNPDAFIDDLTDSAKFFSVLESL